MLLACAACGNVCSQLSLPARGFKATACIWPRTEFRIQDWRFRSYLNKLKHFFLSHGVLSHSSHTQTQQWYLRWATEEENARPALRCGPWDFRGRCSPWGLMGSRHTPPQQAAAEQTETWTPHCRTVDVGCQATVKPAPCESLIFELFTLI